MGICDVAEVCELVGFYVLDILRKEFGDNKIGLYRDDELSCFQNLSDPEPEKIKKKLCKIFKKHGSNITVECNLQITDFSDVTFDLRTGKFHVIKSALIKLPLFTLTHLKTAVSAKILNSHHKLLKEKNAVETFYCPIHRLAST